MFFQNHSVCSGLSLFTLAAFLATMIPPRVAHADATLGPIGQGTGGGPTLATPSGPSLSGGALATIDVSTGAANAAVAFDLPAARGAAQPSLALSYNSTSGTGFAGTGWTLNVPSIERRGSAGVPNYDSDVLGAQPTSDRYWFDGSPLVPICKVESGATCTAALRIGETLPNLPGWTYFRTELDGGMRFFFSPTGTTWMVQTKSGVTMTFGQPNDTIVQGDIPIERGHDALTAPTPVTSVLRWNLARQTDTVGNTVFYQWARLQSATLGGVDPTKDQGLEYLTDIYDTGAGPTGPAGSVPIGGPFAHHTRLTWSTPDSRLALLAQSPTWRTPPALHLDHVDVTSAPFSGSGARGLVRRYWLTYGPNANNTQVLLEGVRLEGACNGVVEQASGSLPATSCPSVLLQSMTYTSSPLTVPLRLAPHTAMLGVSPWRAPRRSRGPTSSWMAMATRSLNCGAPYRPIEASLRNTRSRAATPNTR